MRAFPLVLALAPCMASEAPQIKASRDSGPLLSLTVDAGLLPHGSHPKAMEVYRLVARAVKDESLEWGLHERLAMVGLAWEESRYNPSLQNPRSTAYGTYQFLDSSWNGTGIAKTDDPYLQTVAAARYIRSRYKCPCRALEFQTTPRMLNGRMQRYY